GDPGGRATHAGSGDARGPRQPAARQRDAGHQSQHPAQEAAAARDAALMTLAVRRALVSVSDKAGVAELAKSLADLGVEILSTGGTAKLLAQQGIPVVEVSDHTGFPEMLDGRVKTLHPTIHGGLLARR